MLEIEQIKEEILQSNIFDSEWYKKTYPDVVALGLDPLEHFLRFGILMGRNPSLKFNTQFYVSENNDVAQSGTPALLHYLRHGRREGRAATPLPPAPDTEKSKLPNINQSSSHPLQSLPRTAPRKPHWIWRMATDAFMLRGLDPSSQLAVIINASNDSEWMSALNAIPSGVDTDLFLLGSTEFDFTGVPDNVRTLTYLGAADDISNAKRFVTFAASGAADSYEALLWLSPQDSRSDNEIDKAARLTDSLLNTSDRGDRGDWGIVGIQTESVETFPPLKQTLQIAMPRLGLAAAALSSFANGSAIWIRPLLLRALGSTVRPFEMTAENDNKPFPGRLSVLAILSAISLEAGMKVHDFKTFGETCIDIIPSADAADRQLKAVAFYLPQFHPIPENDKWWGKGFTEWTNVVRGKPLFRNHYQPRVPADLGYYDLRLEDTLVAQADLARSFGLHGFCYYYYWFNGKKLLNHPIEQMAKSSRADIGFCACWANENWSRNWDGQNKHVLLKQEYSLETNVALIREMIPMMKDPRWIRYNGRPVMMVYRVSIIPNWMETAEIWREECRKAGLGEIHLCAVRFGLEPLQGQPHEHNLDSYVLFPPHEASRLDLRDKVMDLHKDFNGEIFDYNTVVDGDLNRYAEGYEWPVHRGTMLAWDNTARRLTDSRIFHGATPYGFRRWMKALLAQEQKYNKSKESLVLINAWNEWAEGTYLEPDQRWGRTNLSAFKSAVDSVKGIATSTINPGTAAKPKLPAILADAGSPLSSHGQMPAFPIWHSGAMASLPGQKTVMVCAHISGHHLFGGERSFLDVLDALARLSINVIATLPSGNNKAYVEEVRKRCSGVYILPYPQWCENRPPQAWLISTFADLIARHNVDAVHANTIMLLEPLAAAMRMKRTTIIHSRELISLDDQLQQRLGLNVSEVVSKVLARTNWLIGNSRSTCTLFAKGDRTLYVPNAVNISDFEGLDNKYNNTIKFGIVSSNIPKKGIADFVEVAKRAYDKAPRARFVVIGPENQQTRIWADEVDKGLRPQNIEFLGYRDTPRSSMVELNVLLNLSNFAESFGRTVAEAMAAKRPVIAYDWGALSELVKSDTGILVPYRDIDAVVEAVTHMCDNSANIKVMGEAGQKFIESNFSQQNLQNAVAVAYEKIFDSAIPVRQLSSACADGEPYGHPRTTVLIPVYNAAQETLACIKSVIKHTDLTANSVVVINDGSSDPDVDSMLSEFSGTAGLTLLKNETNIGYTRTINRGIDECGHDDIVLLNSDTIVTPRWLEGLRSTAYSREKVATVTAMSDNAGAFSFPTFNAFCPKPDNLSHEEYALLLTQGTQDCIAPEVPTGSGFCMYIRRALIEECGVFDHEGFPRGYGEENDFCMRALKAGWTNLISPWAFVYHVRTASFKGEKTALVKAGVDVVTKRYPDYASLVKEAFDSLDMQSLRKASRVF